VSILVRRRLGAGGLSAAAALASYRARGRSSEPRTHALARTVVTAVWLVAVLVQLAALAIWLARGAPRLPISFAGGPWALLAVTTCSLLTLSMGVFLARRLPGNLVGWVMMVPGLALMPILPSALMVHDALEVLRPVPALTMAVAWAMSSLSTPLAVGAFSVVLLLFPDGRPSSARWTRLLLVPLGGMVLASLGSALDPTLVWYPMLASPQVVVIDGHLAGIARFAGFLALVASMLIAAASLIDRYRDAGDLLRRQIRWAVLDGTLTALAVAPLLVGRYLLRPGDTVGELLVVVAALGAATFPIAVAIAITRADLFDIDVIISRTLVYLPLTAILAGMYAALVAFLQRVFVALTGDTSDAVIVLSTLVLAAAFTPVRQAIDGFVERHFRAPHGLAGQAPSGAMAREDPGMDQQALLTLLATHVERLEAVEARLLHLEHGPRLGRGMPVKRGSRRAPPAT
jgi:hypothetical protein